jgi:uncharacterized membrane protein
VGRHDRRGRAEHPDRLGHRGLERPGRQERRRVRFDDHGGTTGVEVSLQYDPPAGVLGEAVAKIFADPQTKVERALDAFKERIESAVPGSGTTVKQS